MLKPKEDRSVEGFLRLLSRGSRSRGDKLAALDALAQRRVTLASWEPQAEGFRTLLNDDGEEALAVFSSEDELHTAAEHFGWLDDEGAIAIQEGHGAEIIRHAWTREYAFLVIDVASSHALEYTRDELEIVATREVEQTGKFRSSRPPPRAKSAPAPSKVPKPPVSSKPALTQYSMTPPIVETLSSAALSKKPRRPSPSQPRVPKDEVFTVEVTVPVVTRASQPAPVGSSTPPRRSSAKPMRKKVTTPRVQEVPVDAAVLGAGGTYGAASTIAPNERSSKKPKKRGERKLSEFETTDPGVPFLEPEDPALPSREPIGAQPPETTPDPAEPETAVVETPEIELSSEEVQDDELQGSVPIVDETVDEIPEDEATVIVVQDDEIPESEPTVMAVLDAELETTQSEVRAEDDTRPVDTSGSTRRKAKRLKERSIHDSIELSALESAPDEDLLKDISQALRAYPEIDWASICRMSDGGATATVIGIRMADNYRENVDAIVQAVLGAGQPYDPDLDILLIDGHDLLRQARESSFVFFPWKPKPFGS